MNQPETFAIYKPSLLSFSLMATGSYFSPEVETLARSDLDALIDERVRYTVQYAAEHSPFYRHWFHENNINITEIREHEDLLNLPVILSLIHI